MTQMWVKFTNGVSYVMRFPCCQARAWRGQKGGGRGRSGEEGGGGDLRAAACRSEGTERRTGSSVEAQLAESVAGQISWRMLSSGGVAHHTKGSGQTGTALINPPI